MDAYNFKLLGSTNTVADRLRWHWDLTPDGAAACTLCGACEQKCTQHLPIQDRLKEIAASAEKQQDANG